MAGRVSLGTSLAGIELPSPVLVASGTFGTGVEMSQLVELRKIGGIVTKSVTPQPVRGMPTPRMVETPSGMLNAIGLQNPGVEAFVEKDGPFIAQAGVSVIVSIAGKSVQEYAEVAVRVSKIPGVVGIEANISCPNVERRNQVFACDPQAAGEVIGTVTRMTHLPVFAKLTADVTDLVEVAESCVRAGAHGLSLINTLLGMAIDVETFRPRLGGITGGLSGPAIRAVAVRCVFQVAR
ncbi:MAG: dihydroorotate dehydrogenase, partial [Actinomycetota bacterium]